MEKIEKISKKIGTAASETYNEVVDKSGKVIEDTKVKLSITEKEEKIYEMYAEMGSVVYEMYQKGENVGDVFGKICKDIEKLNNEIEEKKKKKLENKGLKECAKCGKEIQKESRFCPNCGAHIF